MNRGGIGRYSAMQQFMALSQPCCHGAWLVQVCGLRRFAEGALGKHGDAGQAA